MSYGKVVVGNLGRKFTVEDDESPKSAPKILPSLPSRFVEEDEKSRPPFYESPKSGPKSSPPTSISKFVLQDDDEDFFVRESPPSLPPKSVSGPTPYYLLPRIGRFTKELPEDLFEGVKKLMPKKKRSVKRSVKKSGRTASRKVSRKRSIKRKSGRKASRKASRKSSVKRKSTRRHK